jgi:copper chaperone
MKHLIFFFSLILATTAFASEKNKTITLNVSGMTCQGCASSVEKALQKVDGVKEAKVNLSEKKVTIVLASAKTTVASLIKAVDDAGFTASEGKVTPKTEMKKKKTEGDDCDGDCCGDDCGTDSKPAKAKKTESKKS